MGDFGLVVGIVFVGVVGIYVIARLITSAYFRSRQDFERKKYGPGTQQGPRL